MDFFKLFRIKKFCFQIQDLNLKKLYNRKIICNG